MWIPSKRRRVGADGLWGGVPVVREPSRRLAGADLPWAGAGRSVRRLADCGQVVLAAARGAVVGACGSRCGARGVGNCVIPPEVTGITR